MSVHNFTRSKSQYTHTHTLVIPIAVVVVALQQVGHVLLVLTAAAAPQIRWVVPRGYICVSGDTIIRARPNSSNADTAVPTLTP